ncbi:ammonium transporter [Desulfosporosinus metallidurans]|uniref:Ammonium transporter n=1 Tax=Desulfosporosinus metallidurans TaxID=1888891 RepID=A0A1Q8QWX6_9FIRM|nr:ammonium transporter [Desulfosporosinus metallidurans]OLN31805.1 Ammonium transporter [Desulfosporosinus metallidurans]
MDTGDTGFILISTALVFLMTPGLALFYGGMVRKKNVLSTLMHSWIVIGIISVQWILVGYTLAFGPDYHGIIGSLNWLGLSGVGVDPNADYAATIPAIVFMAFQMMFAVITPALISGSIAERMRFPAFVVFVLLWATFVYDPLAHWVWGVGGFLRTLGALDFAGGNVVHISSGYSALIAALLLGKRKGLGKESMAPHHIPMTVLGAGLLWFGWFGFNAGSALGANGLAGMAFVNTNTAAASAAMAWAVVERFHRGKSTVLGAASGAVAGLVAITPGAGFVTPLSSIFIGLVGGTVCYLAISLMKAKFGYDDALDAFGCHGIGGTWGALATGIFATKTINSAGADGLFYGNASLLGIQAVSVLITVAFTVLATFIILKAIGLVMKLRVSDEQESTGLDLSLHGETAYSEFI